jgi:cytochrome oxidase Cu insertion factor (SCO1/SenC/PrrC family)
MKNLLICINILLHTSVAMCQESGKKIMRSKPVHIDVRFLDASITDSVKLSYRDHYWGNVVGIKTIDEKDNGKKNSFNFKIQNNDKAAYINIWRRQENGAGYTLARFFLAEPGDKVKINVAKDSLSFDGFQLYFSGIGAAKYQCQYEMEQLTYKKEYRSKSFKYTIKDGNIVKDSLFYSILPDQLKDNISINHKLTKSRLEILERYRNKLTPFIYNLLKADVISWEELANYNRFSYKMSYLSVCRFPFLRNNVEQSLRQIYSERYIPDLNKIPSQYRHLSNHYIGMMLAKTADTTLTKNSKYPWLKSNFNGILRDRILTAYFLRYYTFYKGLHLEVEDALKYIKTDYCRKIIASFATLIPGAPAFDFALPDSSNKIVKLKDLRGKVIILDFWFTGCTGCAQMKEKMEPVAGYFKNNDKVVFVTVNIDQSFTMFKRGLRSKLYTHSGSIDLFANGAGYNSLITKHYNIFGAPNLILIDPNGKIITGSPPRPPRNNEFVKLVEMYIVK